MVSESQGSLNEIYERSPSGKVWAAHGQWVGDVTTDSCSEIVLQINSKSEKVLRPATLAPQADFFENEVLLARRREALAD